ncbi:hypothetical protein BN1708_016512, partial [Verticillium longisporum]
MDIINCEDAPALDALPVFNVTERDGAVYLTGEEAAIKGSRRKPNFKCRSAAGAGTDNKVVIVGGGSGALGAVEGLRNGGFDGPITIISKEGYLPIDRPKLSKALLTDPEKLQWRDAAWYESGSVEIVNDEVTDVDFSGRTVTTKNGGKHAYGKLVLATGGTPRNLPLQGFKVLENIFTLRTIHDTKKITAAIGDKGKKIVIRGFATGIAATAGSIGGIVFPVLLQKLLPKLGFGWTARILGFILLGLAVPANLFIRSRLPPRDKLTSVWPDLSVFKDMKFTISAVGIFFMEWGLFVPLTYIVSYAARYSASGNATDSYTLLSIMNAGSALGRFIPGFVADKIGRFNVIIFTIAMCIVTTFGLWLPAGDSEPMLIAFAVLFGFASGSN